MKIALITPGYPSKDNKYNLRFVHVRAKNYKKNDLEIDVFVTIDEKSEKCDDIYKGIDIYYRNIDSIFENIEKYDGIFIHFINETIAKKLLDLEKKVPVLTWVHGTEALLFYRRLFNLRSEGLVNFIKYALASLKRNFLLNLSISKLISNHPIGFVFPSKWMKDIAEKDWNLKFDQYKIIANPIDTKTFSYNKKDDNQRFKITSIKSFRSYKYGTDILQKIILNFLEDNRFEHYKEKVEFRIYGDGKLFDKHTKKLKNKKNVTLERGFLTHEEMSNVFSENGIFINTTRQDAQGVTMCEAMMSGLVVLSSANTAIPEFITDGFNGILCSNVDEFVDNLYKVLDNNNIFQNISRNAGTLLRENLQIENIVNKEMEFFYEISN